MKKALVFSLLSLLSCVFLNAQDEKLLETKGKLASCKVEIPLTYKKKDAITCEKAAVQYKDKQLVLLSYDKKSNDISFEYYYIDMMEAKGRKFVYLVRPEDHGKAYSDINAIFLKFNPEYDSFYLADCFDEVMKDSAN